MKYLIIKTEIEQINGDRKIDKTPIRTNDIEDTRKEIKSIHPFAKKVTFTYEEL